MPASRPRIVLAGGAGFLGQALAAWFDPWADVVVLTRRSGEYGGRGQAVAWDGRTPGAWHAALDGAALLINLAGRSVNCRYHARNRALILNSRLDSTRALGQAIGRCQRPPAVWLNSSTATIYRHSFEPMDEATGVVAGTPAIKDEFSVEVAQAWEQAFFEAPTPATRRVALRTAMVFGNAPGTVYRVLRRLARCGLGGAMGDGQQYVSWLHEQDFCRAVDWLIRREDFSGVVNLASPRPLSNRAMMHVIRRAAGVPCGLPATRTVLEVGAWLLRTETELILKSRRVVPGRLLAAGFTFRYPTLVEAVAQLEGLSRPAVSGLGNQTAARAV